MRYLCPLLRDALRAPPFFGAIPDYFQMPFVMANVR